MLPAFSVHPSVPVKLSRVLQLVANKIHQDRQVRVRLAARVSPISQYPLEMSLTYLEGVPTGKYGFDVRIFEAKLKINIDESPELHRCGC